MQCVARRFCTWLLAMDEPILFSYTIASIFQCKERDLTKCAVQYGTTSTIQIASSSKSLSHSHRPCLFRFVYFLRYRFKLCDIFVISLQAIERKRVFFHLFDGWQNYKTTEELQQQINKGIKKERKNGNNRIEYGGNSQQCHSFGQCSAKWFAKIIRGCHSWTRGATLICHLHNEQCASKIFRSC